MRRSGDHRLTAIGAVLLFTVVYAAVVQAQQAARIDTVAPTQAAAGQIVTITGIGFGARNVKITVGGIPAQVIAATGSRVTFVIPDGVACGPTVITATNPGGHTGRIAFSVCGSVNAPPVVNAGPELTVTLPNAASLNGSVTDDGFPPGSVLTIQWSTVSGPGTVTFANANSASTTASFSEAGTYVLKLTASDTEVVVSDETTITVHPANQPPVVHAGLDLAITLPNTALLSGAVSDDGLPPGSTLTTQWSKVSGPGAVTFSAVNAATTTASFSEAGPYVVRLTATDSEFVVSDEATIDVSPANRAPIANAGDDFSVRVTKTAQLDGSASIDPDSDPLTFSWTFVSIPAGSSATLTNPATATPTFVLDRPGPYVVRLAVHDGVLESAPDTVTVTSENTPPVANAGPDQTGPVATTITLDATASSDVDGDALTYEWTIQSTPLGSGITLSDAATLHPTFVIDQPGSYVLQLVVHDGLAASEPDTVVVSTVNSAPVANAGPDQTVFVTQTVTLNAGNSSDVDGDPLAFFWMLVSAPDGSTAVLANATGVMPTFVVDKPGTYVAQLTVNDGTTPSAPDTVTITTANSAPVANAGPDQTTLVNQTVVLDGSASTDVDGDPLTYAWSLVSVPAGSSASVTDPTAIAPAFVADRPGTYVAQLIVSEPHAVSAPDTVTITTLNSAPLANAGLDQTVVAGQVAFLNGASSSDVDGDPLTFQWSFTGVPPGSSAVLVNSTSAGPSFTVDRTGTFVVQLIVNDGTVNSAPDAVMIDTTNSVPVANAGPDQLNVRVGATITLDGSLSSDADAHTLTYSWSLTARPAGSAAVISDPTAIGPTFTADVAGDYVAQLIVNDGFSNSAPDTVLIRAADAPVVTVTASDAAAAEAGLDTGTFTFTRTGDTTSELVVHFTVGGNATDGVDYVSIPPTVTIGAGQISAVVVVTPIADAEIEGPETVVVTLDADPAYGLGLQTVATVTIAGEQLPNMTLSLVGSPVVGVGKDVQLQILLGQAAPPGGVMVAIGSDDLTRLTVGPPATAMITGGGTLGFVTLHGISRGATTVRGTAPGFADASLDVVVSNNTIAAPITLNVPLGQVTDFPVSITREPANNGPVVITIVSDNPAAVVVNTPIITILAGELSANAIVFGRSAGLATLTSTSPNFATDTSAVTTTAHLEMLNLGATATMSSGFSLPITIQLESPPGTPIAAPAGGIPVTIVAANPACVAAPAPGVVVAQGTTTTVASISYGGSAPLPCTTTVTVAGPTGVTPDSVTMTVNPAPAITLPTFKVGGGLQTINLNAFLGDANHGGITVRLVSSDPTRVLLAASSVAIGEAFIDIPVANGVDAFSYYVQGGDWVDGVSSAAAVTVTASATGFSNGSGTINYVRPVLDVINLFPTTTSLSANTDFIVRVGVPTAVNTIQSLQARRFGAPALVVTATNSNAAVAEIDHNGGVDGLQAQTSTITAGQFTTPNGAAGGFEFDPIGVGSTTVTASIPGFMTLPAGIQTVTVTGPGISMPSTVSLGGGLQHGALQGSLGASQHGGVTVHIASADPARVKIAANANSAGADAIDVPVANGTTSFTFYLQGADWVAGVSTTATVTVTASATGFSNGTSSVDYLQPVLDIINLFSPTTSLSANTDFVVRVGVPTATNTMRTLQARRFGAPALEVTASNNNAAVAEIDHNGGVDGAQAQTSMIAAGQTITPNNAAGGLEFDPLGVGTTIVTASIPGFITLPAGVQAVTVTGAGITMPNAPTIAGGLQSGSFQGFLGASNHGGVTVHLQSSDPSRILLAPNGTSLGAASIDIPVANGATAFAFFLQGTDWLEGVSSAQPVTVTATATGFSPGTSTVSYVRPVLDIINLPPGTTALSANTDFVIRVGVPNAINAMQTLQSRRFGAAPLVVTVTNSNAGIAEIDQNGGLNGAQAQTSSIVAGQSQTPNGAAGGFEFDPFGTGTTVVHASIPNFLSLPAATVTVTVTTPAITLPPLEAIGGGLMYGLYTGTLGGSQHGGVQVHLVSSDPSRLLLAATNTAPGAAAIDIPVANGANGFNFFVVGTDWVDGVSSVATVTVTGTASGFTADAAPISYVRPALDLANLATSVPAASLNRDFNIRVGIPNATNTGLRLPQWRRAGASDLIITLTNSNAAAAELDQNGGLNGAQVQIARIVAGQSTTPFNASGGLEFDPLGVGTTVLTATIPNFATLPAAGFTVNVTP